MWHQLKDNMGWGICIIQKEGFSLNPRTSHCQKFPAEFQETLNAFQWHVIKAHNEPNVNLCVLHKSRDICELSSYNVSNSFWSSLGRTPPFQRFMLNLAGRILCSSEAAGYASSSITTGYIIQARQILAEEPDKECPTKRGKGGLLRHLPTSLELYTPKSKHGPPCWGLGMRLKTLSWKKIMLRNPKGKPGPNLQGHNVKEERTELL